MKKTKPATGGVWAQFRRDIEAFVSREAVEAAVIHMGRFELPPLSDIQYFGFADPYGSSDEHD